MVAVNSYSRGEARFAARAARRQRSHLANAFRARLVRTGACQRPTSRAIKSGWPSMPGIGNGDVDPVDARAASAEDLTTLFHRLTARDWKQVRRRHRFLNGVAPDGRREFG